MDPVLSRRALNRALLARQLLLERSPAPLPRALERVGGIQAQYAPSMYFGLWSRLRDLDPAAVTRGLERARRPGDAHALDHPPRLPGRLLAARARRGEVRRRSWARSVKGDEAAMRRAAARLREALRAGPLRRAEIEALIGKEEARWPDTFSTSCACRRPAPGSAAAPTSTPLAEDWLGPPDTTAQAGRDLLATLPAGFGPATRADVASFTGFSLAEVGAALAGVPAAALPGRGRRASCSTSRGRRCRIPDAPAPPRLIPTWDAILLVHARRTGSCPRSTGRGSSPRRRRTRSPTFLVDGAVAGTWRVEQDRCASSRSAPRRAGRRALEAEADRMAAVFWGR